MGSKSKSQSTTSNTTRHETTTNTTTNTTDSRDFSDKRSFRFDDRSIDKRAVLKDAQQIMDSIYVNVDPSDEVLKSQILSWERQATALIEARRFDASAANNLLNEIVLSAERGIISINNTHLAQISAWQDTLEQGLDFAAASLATGERLVQSAGDRQRSLSERILDLAAGSVGQTSSGQIRLVIWTLIGVAGVVLAANRGRTRWTL
ncbi:hypothetical protein [Tateyamaria sp.]|uniref:hypothetical protein n=1 Tax=Tateyamaria sp. TaxID=1929288 RepID=UPI003B20FF67